MPKYYNDEFYLPPDNYTEEQGAADYAYWCERDRFIRSVKKNETYQKWRKRALRFVLFNLCPRIAVLWASEDLAARAANLIHHLTLTFQFTGNNVWQHKKMLSLMDSIPSNMRFLIADILEKEEIVAWEKEHGSRGGDAYWEWKEQRELARERKSQLRSRRLRRAFDKAERLCHTPLTVYVF